MFYKTFRIFTIIIIIFGFKIESSSNVRSNPLFHILKFSIFCFVLYLLLTYVVMSLSFSVLD